MGDSDGANGDSGGSRSRSQRQKQDKVGRLAALQKLKSLKGTKNKYEIGNVDSVYEEVDEREYSKRVQERAEEDWIVDDDGLGYVEDGREIFDDDLDDDAINKSKGSKSKGKKNAGQPSGPGKTGIVKSNNIKSMFLNMPSKKTEKEAKLNEDNILDDIMEELHSTKSSNTPIRPSPVVLKRKINSTPSSLMVKTPTSVPRASPYNSLKRTLPAEPKRLPFSNGASVTVKEEKFDSGFSSQEADDLAIEMNDSISTAASSATLTDSVDITEFSSQQSMETKIKTEPEEEPVEIKPKVEKATPQISEADLTSGWETIRDSVAADQTLVPEVVVDSSELPLVENENGDKILRFYWFDAYEDSYAHPGVVYLFGKVYVESAKTYVSCCVAVKNIERHIYVLPRETRVDLRTGQDLGQDVSFTDVYEEFNDRVAEKYKILQFKSRRVTKKYAFDPLDVPRESEYLEVRYSSDYPALPQNIKGATFSHVFGTNATALENFLLSKHIKGPCWLNIKTPAKANPPVSWCKVEAIAVRPDLVEVSAKGGPPPPLKVLSISLRTVVHSQSQQNEIVAIGCLVHQQFHIDKAAPHPPFQQHFCILSRPSDEAWPLDHRESLATGSMTKIEKADSERILLTLFLAKYHKIDPDIVVGHDIANFDIDILLHRIGVHKVPHWSRIGRLRRQQVPNVKGAQKSYVAMCGRLVCDVKLSSRELIRARSYDLPTLCQQVLGITYAQPDLSSDAVRKMYAKSTSILTMVGITMQDASNTLKLMYELSVIPLAVQITTIAGNLLSRTLLGGRSERNEYLLLHAFYERGYIVPDKQAYGKKAAKARDSDNEDDEEAQAVSSKKGRRKPAYTGGLVLEPKRGFYDKYILLMDFNSLYPSIMQEYNICFTTVDRSTMSKNEDEEELPELPDPGTGTGILPSEIRKLVESRREVKQLMKGDRVSSDVMMQYDIRQKALKLTANSMYGCLGFSHSRFHAKPLAALITAKGREILLQTRELVKKLNLDVVYGDTDSLMINTNSNDYDQVLKLGLKIKSEVNKLYRHLELDVDGVFQRLLLLKKKKYAAVTVTKTAKGEMVTQQELKGLDIVRRDWSQLAVQAGRYALEQILSDLPADERVTRIQQKLEEIRDSLNSGETDVKLLAVTKQLTKNPEDYPDSKNLSHVQVAIRANSRGGKKLRQGDTVSFVICQDGTNLAATQRAYSLDEMKSNNLKPDVQYYLAQQVHPVVSRLCELIEGIDNVRIAEFLGLDTSTYRASQHSSIKKEEDAAYQPISDQEKFLGCDRLKFKCPKSDCGSEIVIEDVFRKLENDKIEFSLLRCSNSNCTVSPLSYVPYIANRLTLAIRAHIQRYYANWLICEDPSCPTRTRRLSTRFNRGYPICIGCRSGIMYREYNEKQLYTQLCFYQHIFNVKKAMTKLSPLEQKDARSQLGAAEKGYLLLSNCVEKFLHQSSYSSVDLGKLFSSMLLPKKSH